MQKNVMISIDDVGPQHMENVLYIVKALQKHGIFKINLAVVPKYEGKYDFTMSKILVAFLQSQQKIGSDIIMHGYHHHMSGKPGFGLKNILFGRVIGRGESEFLNLNHEESAERLDAGLKLFHKFGIKPEGFLPPVWVTSSAAKKEIMKRFKYCIYFSKIKYHMHSRTHAIIPFQSDYPQDKLIRIWANVFSKLPYKNITISLHPQDVKYGTQFEFALDIIRKYAEHNITTYSKL